MIKVKVNFINQRFFNTVSSEKQELKSVQLNSVLESGYISGHWQIIPYTQGLKNAEKKTRQ